MNEVQEGLKLPKEWKETFLNKLKNGCYKYTRSSWYRKLSIEEFEQGLEEGQTHEYAHCVLGAAYHHSIGKNRSSEGYKDKKVPDVFKNPSIRGDLMSLNDTSESNSYKEVIEYIERNL